MALRRRILLIVLSLVLLPVASTTPANAGTPAIPAVAMKSDTGWRILRADSGGTVYGPDNVSITVPAGVMKRDGKVLVQEIFPGVYNIHITPRWKGKVTVRLPMTGDLPVVAHKRHGTWVLERAHAQGGQAVAKVRSLSLFSAIRECAAKLISTNPKAAALNTIRCFIKHGIRAFLPSFIAKKIVGLFSDWDPCKPVGWDNWSIDAFEIFFSSCHAGETTVPTPAPVTPTTPAPAPKPAPVPTPAPAPAGNMVEIDHGGGWKTWYAHLGSVSINNPIDTGEQVGTVGNTTGTGSISPHLHYEQRLNGVAQPVAFDGQRIAVGTSYTASDPKVTSTNCGGGGGITDGTFVSYNGDVFRIAGGAPIYVSSWDHVGGNPGYVRSLSAAEFGALRQYPADGTYIVGLLPGDGENGSVYRIAGGAPIYVSNWDHVGGNPGTTVGVDLFSIRNAGGGGVLDHLRQRPADGTYLVGLLPGDGENGSVYRVAGGAPIYVSNWDHVGGNPGTTVGVDLAAIRNAGGVGVWNHLLYRPVDGTYLKADQKTYRVAQGAPILQSATHDGVVIDPVAIANAGKPGVWSHLAAPPVQTPVVTPGEPPSPAVPLTAQSVAQPRASIRKGRRLRLPQATTQGATVTWNARPKRVCTVKRHTLKAKHKGRCVLRASAPALPGFQEYASTVVVRVR